MMKHIEDSFVLSYYTSLTKSDIDEMSLFERTNWLSLLEKQKKIENEQNK